MNIILVIFLINTIVSAESSSDETKYIDLLPEKEKEEFLERIARRIFDNTASKESKDDVSREVTDASLEKHNQYVQTLLKEESLNLRKRNGEVFLDIKKQDNTSENINPLEEKTARDELRDDDRIDLTLRDDTRIRKNSDIKIVNNNSKIIKIQPGHLQNDITSGSVFSVTNFPQNNNKLDAEESKITFLNNDLLKDESNGSIKKINTPETDSDNVVHKRLSEELVSPSNEKEDIFASESIMLNENKDISTKYENIKDENYIMVSNKPYESQENKQLEQVTLASVTIEAERQSTTNKPTSADAILPQSTTEKTKNNNSHIDNVNPDALTLRSNYDDVTFYFTEKPITNHTIGFENSNLFKTSDVVLSKSQDDDITTNVLDINDKTNARAAITTTTMATPEPTTDEKNIEVLTVKPNLRAKISDRNNDDIDVNPEQVFTKTVYLTTKTNTDLNVDINRNSNDNADNISNNLANDMIKVLRPGKQLALYKNNFKDLKALHATMKQKEYNVYEVSAKEDPFIRKGHPEILNKEQPYYVPVYNYSPNNAYYNPRNRLGPNDNENEQNIVNPESIDNDDLKETYNHGSYDEGSHSNIVRRDVNNESSDMESIDKKKYDLIPKDNRKFRFGYTKKKGKDFVNFKLNLPVVVRYPKVTELYINSNDYLDMDYYYGRSNKPRNSLAISSETDRLSNNMNLKTYVRAIRLLLYKQKHFGFIPPLEQLHRKSSKNSRSQMLDRTKQKDVNPTDSNIAMDYFFGRINDNIDGRYVPKFTKSPEALMGNKRFQIKHAYNAPKTSHKQYNTDNDNYLPNQFRVHRTGSKNHYMSDDLDPATPTPDIKTTTEKKKKKKGKHDGTNFDTVKQILQSVDERDLMPTLEKLLKMNVARNGADIEPYVEEMRNMLLNSTAGLKQYDWLGTTVDVQAALAKIIAMTDTLLNHQTLSSPDLQLLKYCIYLHKSINHPHYLRKKLLPKNKKKRKKKVIKDKGLYNRVWLFRMLAKAKTYKKLTDENLKDFSAFLSDVQYYLYDLHKAVLNISSRVNYRNQRWWENLQSIYLNNSEKQTLEVLLHLTITRLMDLIEKSAKNGLENDFLTYAMKNEKVVEKTKEELAIALKIIDELKRLHHSDRHKYIMKLNYIST